MKRLIWVVLITTLFTGCFLFRDQSQKEDCLELVDRSQIQLRQAIVLLDSVVIENMRLKAERDSCRASNNSN
jgi:hypothetical protein